MFHRVTLASPGPARPRIQLPGVFRANAHIELPLTGATLYFDDRLIIVDGEFTRESGMRAPNRRPGTGSAWQEVEGHVLPAPPTFDD